MMESRKELLYTIASPQYHGAELGFTEVFGDPPESIEEFKQSLDKAATPDYDALQKDMEAGNKRMLDKLRQRQAEKAEREHRQA